MTVDRRTEVELLVCIYGDVVNIADNARAASVFQARSKQLSYVILGSKSAHALRNNGVPLTTLSDTKYGYILSDSVGLVNVLEMTPAIKTALATFLHLRATSNEISLFDWIVGLHLPDENKENDKETDS